MRTNNNNVIKNKIYFLSLFICFILFGLLHAHYDEYNDNIAHPRLRLMLKQNDRIRNTRAMPMISFEPPPAEESGDYWNEVGQNTLAEQLKKNQLNLNKAKNIILFLGDGLSLPTITAGRIYMGGEESQFYFEKFPYVGLSKTYCANTQVADSACTATAYLSGVKGNYATVGVSAAVDVNDCKAQNNTAYHAPSIAQWAQEKGMATGLVTTTSVTHASPSGIYAHIANRFWESDDDIYIDGGDPLLCRDIAHQLIYDTVGHNLRVVMGGGREQFLPKTQKDITGNSGKRRDNINLIDEWKQRHSKFNAKYVETKDELFKLSNDTEFVMGLFDTGNMPFHLDADNETIPTLAEMVDKALNVLEHSNNKEKGYFLFVEGGRIDHAHHNTEAIIAIDETIEFDKAIKLARERTNVDDTLIVVTSDHSHTMSISGYSSRKNDIFGINNGQMADDELPYATLSYANGPGFEKNILEKLGKRRNLREINMHDKNYKFPTMVPLDSETHGGDDVPVYASGPFAHIFTGSYEQNYIPHGMAYASCIGHKKTLCSS
ncbi:alkaline phosphatase [Condylostylus longicornis]|uniref:alkaline phosphatase n=1 Tax=Condylostylus longicornis TaxID=2530218 RepID=UPI00244E0465|nr:alkaline phosphatase [Condylostylus longicornis]